MNTEERESFEFLMDIAEEFYPKYSSSLDILKCNDILVKDDEAKSISYTLEVMYRDADNWKDYYTVEVSSLVYPEIKDLKVFDTIEMGDYSTLEEDKFFGSPLHKEKYNGDRDHNILEVLDIKRTVKE